MLIVSGTVLGTQDTTVNRMDKNPSFHVASSHSDGRGQIVKQILWYRRQINALERKSRVRMLGS